MDKKSLDVQLRTERGKNENRRLRDQGLIPGVLYSHGDVTNIKIKTGDFFKVFHGNISESVILDLKIDGDEQMAFVKDYQLDPVTGKILHIDFFKVTKGEKIQTVVPLEYVGNAAGTRVGGILEISEREIEIECLPRDLPEIIEIDVSDLDVNDYIHAGEIKIGEGLTLLSNPDTVVVGVTVPRVVEEEEVEEEEGLELEGEGEGDESESEEVEE